MMLLYSCSGVGQFVIAWARHLDRGFSSALLPLLMFMPRSAQKSERR
jgi:hypothetical protein